MIIFYKLSNINNLIISIYNDIIINYNIEIIYLKLINYQFNDKNSIYYSLFYISELFERNN